MATNNVEDYRLAWICTYCKIRANTLNADAPCLNDFLYSFDLIIDHRKFKFLEYLYFVIVFYLSLSPSVSIFFHRFDTLVVFVLFCRFLSTMVFDFFTKLHRVVNRTSSAMFSSHCLELISFLRVDFLGVWKFSRYFFFFSLAYLCTWFLNKVFSPFERYNVL